MATSQPAESAAPAAKRPPRAQAAVFVIAGVALAVLLATSGRYGYFRDTLYYLACARHLAWGYVDQPPLIAALYWLVMHGLGTSLLALAVVPALADAGVIVLTAGLARELGGGRYAQVLAALAAACVPVYLVQGRQFSMNIFEPLLWMGCAWLLLRMIQGGNQRLWLGFGALAGLGLENKYSIAVFAAGLVAGLLLTRERRALAQRWIWLGGLIALAIFLPNLVWNIRHHWPFFELMRNIRASGKNVRLGPAGYWLTQGLMMAPANLLLWLPGLAWLFAARHGRFRALGWAFVVTAGIFMALHGKDYYTAPAYPILLAAGAAAL
ncbi:MAG: glycosyltransferase family 39 protein, partial [Terriglobales bacterium]